MKKLLVLMLLFGFVFTSCSKDEVPKEDKKGETPAIDLEVESFIYRGMNDIYLYKSDVPELADDYFSTATAQTEFLSSFDSPEKLYDALQSEQDRFSFMTADYIALENSFKGVSTTTGMQYGLGRITGTNDLFGYVQYVLPGTSAEEKGIKRGDVFTEIDGTQMTLSNYRTLLGRGSFTINLGTVQNGSLHMTDETVALQGIEYTENPVHIATTIQEDGQTIGYILYNSFTGTFDDELNAAIGELKAQGISDLILDLRYNGGGSVESAVDLASMITGQYNGKIFMKEQWNEDYQAYFEANNPDFLLNKFNQDIRTGEAINSLNLNRVYIITTSGSASASELVINGLDPYIDVIQVGETTTGKFQASVTLYDGEGFSRDNASENHTYAIQPLVLKSVNAAGVSDYVDGLAPDIQKDEILSNLGVLGDPSEPLLRAALNDILGVPQEETSASLKRAEDKFKILGDSDMLQPSYQKMYIDKLPGSVLQK